MIPILFKENEKETVNELYHLLLNIIPYQKKKKEYISNIKAINTWCKNNIIVDGKAYSFSEVIQADFETLTKIAEKLGSCSSLPHQYKGFLIKTLYTYRFPREKFVESLEVTVCPYCNRNFVNSAKKRTMCDLDHFFNKDKYPILAVSFYNLIPVCHSCNHSKSTQDASYSPHDRRYKTNDLLTFDFHLKGIDFLYDSKQIEIEIDESTEMKENIKSLKLNEVYQIHSDIVQECIKKIIVFNPVYLNHLYSEYGFLFDSKEELYRIIFGNYIAEKSFGKRPLSKLTYDIIKDQLETCYGVDFYET